MALAEPDLRKVSLARANPDLERVGLARAKPDLRRLSPAGRGKTLMHGCSNCRTGSKRREEPQAPRN